MGHASHELVKSVDYNDGTLNDPNASEQAKSKDIQKQYTTPDSDGQVVGDTIGKPKPTPEAQAAWDAAHPLDKPPPVDDPTAALVSGAALAKRRRLLSAGGRDATFLTSPTGA